MDPTLDALLRRLRQVVWCIKDISGSKGVKMWLVLANTRASLVCHGDTPTPWVLLVGRWADLGGRELYVVP